MSGAPGMKVTRFTRAELELINRMANAMEVAASGPEDWLEAADRKIFESMREKIFELIRRREDGKR